MIMFDINELPELIKDYKTWAQDCGHMKTELEDHVLTLAKIVIEALAALEVAATDDELYWCWVCEEWVKPEYRSGSDYCPNRRQRDHNFSAEIYEGSGRAHIARVASQALDNLGR